MPRPASKRPQPEIYLRADQNVAYRYVAEMLADASQGRPEQDRLRQRARAMSAQAGFSDEVAAPTVSLRAAGRYAVVWRLHFYAGLLCIPFVLWLALTGSLYLFTPQIDSWIDRRFDRLEVGGPPAAPSAQVKAALAAVEGSVLYAYEVPAGPQSAVRVLLDGARNFFASMCILAPSTYSKVTSENSRLTRLLFYLHGELLLGRPGSMMVEFAASCAVAVMILTGYYLWWPRAGRGVAGLLYPRLSLRGRLFWRDLHAVAGTWVSLFTLFLLISGLPWATSWGGMLKDLRQAGSQVVVRQDWTIGSDWRRPSGSRPASRPVTPITAAAAAEPHCRRPAMARSIACCPSLRRWTWLHRR